MTKSVQPCGMPVVNAMPPDKSGNAAHSTIPAAPFNQEKNKVLRPYPPTQITNPDILKFLKTAQGVMLSDAIVKPMAPSALSHLTKQSKGATHPGILNFLKAVQEGARSPAKKTSTNAALPAASTSATPFAVDREKIWKTAALSAATFASTFGAMAVATVKMRGHPHPAIKILPGVVWPLVGGASVYLREALPQNVESTRVPPQSWINWVLPASFVTTSTLHNIFSPRYFPKHPASTILLVSAFGSGVGSAITEWLAQLKKKNEDRSSTPTTTAQSKPTKEDIALARVISQLPAAQVHIILGLLASLAAENASLPVSKRARIPKIPPFVVPAAVGGPYPLHWLLAERIAELREAGQTARLDNTASHTVPTQEKSHGASE